MNQSHHTPGPYTGCSRTVLNKIRTSSNGPRAGAAPVRAMEYAYYQFYVNVRVPCGVRTGAGLVSVLGIHVGTIYHREMLLILIYSLDVIHVFVNQRFHFDERNGGEKRKIDVYARLEGRWRDSQMEEEGKWDMCPFVSERNCNYIDIDRRLSNTCINHIISAIWYV